MPFDERHWPEMGGSIYFPHDGHMRDGCPDATYIRIYHIYIHIYVYIYEWSIQMHLPVLADPQMDRHVDRP